MTHILSAPRVRPVDSEMFVLFLISGVWVGKRIATAMAYISDFQGKVEVTEIFSIMLIYRRIHSIS